MACCNLHQKLFPSGEQATTGSFLYTTIPLLKTSTGIDLSFIYAWTASGSYLIPCLVCLDVKGFGFISVLAKGSWFLCLWEIKWKLDAVNLYLRSDLHNSLFAWSLVAASNALISSSSRLNFFTNSFSSSGSSRRSPSPCFVRGRKEIALFVDYEACYGEQRLC